MLLMHTRRIILLRKMCNQHETLPQIVRLQFADFQREICMNFKLNAVVSTKKLIYSGVAVMMAMGQTMHSKWMYSLACSIYNDIVKPFRQPHWVDCSAFIRLIVEIGTNHAEMSSKYEKKNVKKGFRLTRCNWQFSLAPIFKAQKIQIEFPAINSILLHSIFRGHKTHAK